jgi:hypothetical protein
VAPVEDDSQFYALLGRALLDPEFRAQIVDKDQQAAALREIGIDPDDETLERLNASIEAINMLASSTAFAPVPAVT